MRYTAEELAQLPSDIDWGRLRAMTEEEVEAAARADPDWEGLLDLEGWTATVVVPPKKAPISIRLDEDVLAFFKASGPGYQKRINAVLRAYMDAAAARKGADEA
ncbi:BrnA antitoxin family protein [Xanthobacter pseudotagetidis]|uniref:BrnA antitoxin family protein n=1 Tax=Xanthobacter pseudotagetidis TaxID=3119911 RepID=UPI00372B8ECD